MKYKSHIRIYLWAILGIFFISTNSCTKPDKPSIEPIGEQLPEKLIISPDLYVEEMDATNGWAVSGLGASLALNNSEVHSGTGSIKVTSGLGASPTLSKSVKWNLSADSGRSFKLWVYPHSAPNTTFTYFTIYAYNDASKNVWKAVFGGTNQLLQDQWTMIWLDPGTCPNGWVVEAGTPNWSAITSIKIKMNTVAGQTSICSFDLISEGMVRKTSVLLTFDDAYASNYTKAYPLIKAKDMVATSYINSNNINSDNKLTSAQIQELYANKWDIANHTKTHPHLNLLTQEEVENEFKKCKVVLDSLGVNRASNHVAYPFGEQNATILKAMSTWGGKTGRITGGSGFGLYEQGVYYLGFPYKINARVIANTTSLEVAKTYVNTAVRLNCASILLVFHNIVDSNATDDYDWLTSDFGALLDFIESLGLQTLTIDEYYRLYSGPITVDHK
jgi:peptidoglycan/xylan/chitin deacetylase (PgdA/CDA1 family)